MSSPGPLFIVGSGPMIGSHIARLFATQSFTRIALFSRSNSNLLRDASFVTSAAPSASVSTYSADVTKHEELTATLQKAISEVGAPEVVVYNAARIQPSKFGTYSTEDIVEDFKIPNLGLYTTATVVLPHLQDLAKARPEAHPALFVTSGSIAYEPRGFVFSLSMAKAAQANMVKVLTDENKDVVHVALVTIGGAVSAEEEVNNPQNIAEKFWGLWEQEKGKWETEVRCGW